MDPIKVLVIDREVDFSSILTTHLNSWGFSAIAASNDQEALDFLEQSAFAVAVVGIEAGTMEGFHTLDRIREHSPEVQIILLAGKNAALSTLSAMQRGAFEVLSLPIELGVLCNSIRRACRNPINLGLHRFSG